MIVDWQYEPIKSRLLHIDLKRIAMDQKLTVSVPIVLKGEAAGVKQQGGILEQILREVEIECLPGDIPSAIEADVSELVFGKVLRVSDLPHDEKKINSSPTPTSRWRTSPRSRKKWWRPRKRLLRSSRRPAEPEVIKKGKQEVERRRSGSCREAGEARKGREEREEISTDT